METFTGTRADGPTVTETATSAGFQPFSLSSLTNVTSVSFVGTSGAAQFDNVKLTPSAPVPEASTTASLGLMLCLCLGGLAVAAKRKKAQG